MILVINVKLIEISAPTPDADDQILMILGVLLRVKQNLSVDGIELKLMTAQIDKRLDQRRNLFNSVGIAEGVVVYLHSQWSAVDDLGHIMLGKGLYAGKRSLQFGGHRR